MRTDYLRANPAVPFAYQWFRGGASTNRQRPWPDFRTRKRLLPVWEDRIMNKGWTMVIRMNNGQRVTVSRKRGYRK